MFLFKRTTISEKKSAKLTFYKFLLRNLSSNTFLGQPFLTHAFKEFLVIVCLAQLIYHRWAGALCSASIALPLECFSLLAFLLEPWIITTEVATWMKHEQSPFKKKIDLVFFCFLFVLRVVGDLIFI